MSYFGIIKTMTSVNYFARSGLTASASIRSMMPTTTIQGGSAQCPRRMLFRQWAQAAAMNDVSLDAMPSSSKELRYGIRRLRVMCSRFPSPSKPAAHPFSAVRVSRLAIAALTLLLAACAGTTTQRIGVSDAASEAEAKKQREIALRAVLDDEARLDRIAYPVLTKVHTLCGENVAYTYGWRITNVLGYGKDFREAATTVLGLDEHVRVRALFAGGAAQKGGVRVGDKVIAINGQELPKGEDGLKKLRDTEFTETIGKAAELSVTVERPEGRSTLALKGEKTCNYTVNFMLGDAVNAFANGKGIFVFRGMMRMAKNDNELALVIGHELAHNAMGHIDKKKQNAGLGSFFDLLAAVRGVNTQGMFGKMAAGAYSQDFEAEADYVGLYMLATTGVDIADAPHFWRRMAAENPGSINSNHAASHPATSYRFLALEKTVQEIAEKQRNNQPLVPEKKASAEEQASQ